MIETRPRSFPLELAWAEREALRDALREHPLVLLRAADLGEDGFVALAADLGAIEPAQRVGFRLAPDSPVMRFGNERDADGRLIAASALGVGWHTDMSFRAHPPDISLLLAKTVPSTGGATQFASLYRLHDQLDPATRAAWTGLEVEHEAASSYFDGFDDRLNVKPLIRRHPDSGRALVFACPAYARRVLGVPESESRAILDRLAASCDPPDYVHRWRPGDLLAWDNRAVLHRATTYDVDQRRELWRLSVSLDREE